LDTPKQKTETGGEMENEGYSAWNLPAIKEGRLLGLDIKGIWNLSWVWVIMGGGFSAKGRAGGPQDFRKTSTPGPRDVFPPISGVGERTELKGVRGVVTLPEKNAFSGREQRV